MKVPVKKKGTSLIDEIEKKAQGDGIILYIEPLHEKTNNLHRRKLRRRSDSNCEADQRLCFCYTDSTIPLLSKSKICSL